MITESAVQEADSLLTVADVCKLVGMSGDWVYDQIKPDATNPLPHVRLGRSVRFQKSAVLEFVDRRAKGSANLGGADGIARAYGGRKSMARRRYQKGYVRLRGRRNQYWEGLYREDVVIDGQVKRQLRSVNLGPASLLTQRQAQRKLSQVINEAHINDVDYRPRTVITLRQFVETNFLTLKLPGKKHTTKHSYGVVLRRHILPDLGDKQLDEVTTEDAQGFINRKHASGVAWNTLRNIKSVLSAVYTAALKYKYVWSHPIRPVELPAEPVLEQPTLPTDKALGRLIDSLKQPYRTMVWLACVSGVRVSELLALRWKSVDWQRQCMWIREVVHDGHCEPPKSHRSGRPIRLTSRDLEQLHEFRKRSKHSAEDDFVFPNTRGTGPFRADNLLERVIRPAAQRLKIGRVTWHLLRHWHNTVLHDEGVPLKATQQRCGHSRAETTLKHYVHVSQEADKFAADVVSRRVNRRGKNRKPRNFVGTDVGKSKAA